MDKTALDYVREYITKGFSVIPLPSGSKKPVIPWTPYQSRYATDEELQDWFGNDSKNNIGIVTGKISGITVVDLDSQEAVKFANTHCFPKTPLVKTGKGYHAYYQYKDGTRNFQKRDDLPGIDLRSEGGIVVAPPSIHPSGQQYQWVKGKSFNDLPFAELPDIILIQKTEDKTPLKDLYQGVEAGSRNDTLARLTGSWVNDGLSFDECLENARLWNSKNTPSLPEKEVARTVKSIFEKHHRSLSEISEIRGGQTDKPIPEPFLYLKRGADLRTLECSIEWCIDKLLPKESITLLHGRGGIGKTWVCLVLADCISRGLPFMGLDTKNMSVVFVDFENSLPVLVDRVRKIGIDEVLFWHNANDVLKPPKLDSLDSEAYKHLPEGSLLIFDTLRASQSRDENNSQDMAVIMSKLKDLRDMGFTILLLHHTPKSNDRTYKGSTAILDLADHVLSLHKVKKGNPEGGEVEDEDDQDCLYRLGTKDKTRYEPFHVFMSFDKEKGFVKASDPDESDMQVIHEFLKEKSRLNQKQIFEIVKAELDIRSKGKLTSLLKKGEGQGFWTSYREKNAVYYEAISSFRVSDPIYPKDGQTPEHTPETVQNKRTDTTAINPETLDNSHVSKFSDTLRTERTEVIDFSNVEFEVVS